MAEEGKIIEDWTQKRRAVVSLIDKLGLEEGKREARRRKMASSTVAVVAKAYEAGERPDVKLVQTKAEKLKPKKAALPSPLLSATFVTQSVALPYQVIDYYDRWRALKNYPYTLAQFITECCEVCTIDLAGLLPTQIVWKETHGNGEGQAGDTPDGQEDPGDGQASEGAGGGGEDEGGDPRAE